MTLMSVRLGANDVARATRFYDAVLAPLGYEPNCAPAEYGICMYRKAGNPVLMLGPARDGNPATHANGGTIGFVAPDQAAVDAFHAAGLANGGTCEGAPGPRPQAGNAYGAYLRDPDGNKICTYFGLNLAG